MWVTFSAKQEKIIHILFRHMKKNDKFEVILTTKKGQPIVVHDRRPYRTTRFDRQKIDICKTNGKAENRKE